MPPPTKGDGTLFSEKSNAPVPFYDHRQRSSMLVAN
jgi:hypothetical protein